MAIEIPVVLLRPGRHDEDTGKLNSSGVNEILRAHNRLVRLGLDAGALIMSSTATWADESAYLLNMRIPGSRQITHADLEEQGLDPTVEDFDGMLERIANERETEINYYNGLVVVTHEPLIKAAIGPSITRAEFGRFYFYEPGEWVPPVGRQT